MKSYITSDDLVDFQAHITQQTFGSLEEVFVYDRLKDRPFAFYVPEQELLGLPETYPGYRHLAIAFNPEIAQQVYERRRAELGRVIREALEEVRHSIGKREKRGKLAQRLMDAADEVKNAVRGGKNDD